ncbi:ABC transporter ATP-binding protein [Acuticoccus kandeliae]|uniref:ABC transporter ATP-binding protein n=1 Tax=Acuticoccus kandeliae TaxID=2073160 RepID=UPI001FE30270|nr:ABC transporter ATP-binding protein [Acuticoccus kandeliae]
MTGQMTAESYLSVEKVAKSYGSTSVMEDLDFSVARGELVSLLGPSGCGKTTLLKLVSGLIAADRGRIVVGGRDITRLPAHKRNISVVFQNYALFPHLNVRDNVAFGLKARGAAAGEIPGRVEEALGLVRMTELAERPIAALSGGQQQRVAVARALVVGPDLILLDEPFSALDRKLRETMQVELKSLLRERGMTAIFVTHDQEEALAVSSRIAVMNRGRIEQYADPTTLYARPSTAFVLDFVGLSSHLTGRVLDGADGHVRVETALGEIVVPGRFTPGSDVLVGVRPENIDVAPAGTRPAEDRIAIETRLADVMILGSKTHLHAVTGEQDRLVAEISGGTAPHGTGEAVTFHWPRASTLVYAGEAG